MGPELFNAEETTGPRTMCRKRRNYHHDDKTSFFFQLQETHFWKYWCEKRVRRSQLSRQDVGLLSRKGRGTIQAAEKKSREFLRGAEDIPIPATAPNWNMALS